jgi:phosphatidylglycerol:prolipoprotein diacylglycerol transferase
MIPYLNGHVTTLNLPIFGTVPIEMFGILVAIGVIVGDRIVATQAPRFGLDPRDVKYLNVWVVLVGFIVAHLVSVIFYFPERIAENPMVLLNVWSGLSSFGGFLGALLAFLFLTKKHQIPRLAYADTLALGLSVGWIFGRAGCFSAHDHPGRHTSFFLAVRYPDGPRHDLGLEEMLFTVVMTAVLFAFSRKRRPDGHVIGLAAVMYGLARFGFDFLRATDVARPDRRYLALTPAQWACLATVALGVHLLRKRGPAADAPPPAPVV